jgi:hypothetical protein
MQVFVMAVYLVIALASPVMMRAQEARGTIGGQVVDANQAVVPGATVNITNTAMGTTVAATTNEAGLFRVLYLIPGTYRLTVEATGFKKYVREGIILRVNDTIELPVQLEPGEIQETVLVTADAPLLDTASASAGQVVDARRIADLPIGHGDPYALIGLSAGVTFTRSFRLDRPFEPTHIVGYTIDGTRANRSDLTIDGAASTATANTGEVISTFVPPQDTVYEFKVQTATFDASFGNTEGGVTNLSVKSGTNNFHGTLAYSNFTKGTSSNDFHGNRLGQPRPDFYYHRFSGTAGGPVWVPKVYNGQNKTFFFYGMEGIREARPRNNGTFNIPTVPMRGGDFSELLAIGPNYQIYNPFSARQEGSRIRRDPFRCDAAGNPLPVNAQRQQDQSTGTPCNKLPASLINPIAKNFVDQYLALPTSPATARDGTGNFRQPNLKERAIYYSHTIRIDHMFNDKHRTFGRASWYDRDSDYNNYFHNLATGQLFQFISRQGVLDHVYAINSTTVLNLRYGYNRFIRGDSPNPANLGFDLTSLGFPSSYANLISPDRRHFPRFDISGYQGTGFAADFRPIDTHSFVGQLNRSLGAHALKGGMEFRAYRENSIPTANNVTGQFNFDNTYTRGPLDNVNPPTQLGFSFAAFLLGIPTSGFINQPADYAEQSLNWGVFFHDDWKVNSKLTLNLGLRWEKEGALTERYNRTVRGFDFNAVQPIEAAARTAFAAAQANPATATPEVTQFNVRGGLTFAGVNGQPRTLYETPSHNFMPRLGLAYQINDKTALRMGYGIFFGFLGQRRGDVVTSGFATTTPLVVTQNSGVTFIETLSNPFQNGLATVPGASQGIETFLGRSLGGGTGGNPVPGFFNPNPLQPYMQRWQLSLQRELPGGFVTEIAYVGNRGTHIEIFRNINALPNQYLSTSLTRDTARINYLTANVPNPFAGMTQIDPGRRGTNIQRQNLLRPYPHFGDLWTTTNEGFSWYHGLQFEIEKRFSRGYTIQASYTFSKYMQATELLNQGDPRPTKLLSDFDRPHRFAMSGIYELPFGRGRQFLSDAHSVVNHIIGGWQVSAYYQFQSGQFINFNGGDTNAAPGTANIAFTGEYRNIRLPKNQQTLQRWFNTDAGFNKDPNQQLQWNLRTFPVRFGFVRGDQVSNVDIGIIKKVQFAESKEFQLRCELLNAFNHPWLFEGSPVNTTPNSAAFGQVSVSNQGNYPRRVQATLKLVF